MEDKLVVEEETKMSATLCVMHLVEPAFSHCTGPSLPFFVHPDALSFGYLF